MHFAMSDKNFYDLPLMRQNVYHRLPEKAFHALREDHEFLCAGSVFTGESIPVFIEIKCEEDARVCMTPH